MYVFMHYICLIELYFTINYTSLYIYDMCICVYKIVFIDIDINRIIVYFM